MKLPSSINKMFAHARRHSGKIDLVRDPYKVWFRLCLAFLLFLIVVICVDLFVFYRLQAGKLITMNAQSQTPPPIIDQNQLTSTANSYASKAAALVFLQNGAASSTSAVDPSK